MQTKEPEDNTPKTVSDIIDSLEQIQTTRFPTIQTYLQVEEHFGQLGEALTIIREYKDGEVPYEIGRMNQDVLKLSAIHVSTAELVGYLQGYARRAEDQRKIVKSRYATNVKRKRDELAKNGVVVKMTETEVDDASRVLATPVYLEAADAETISRMVSQAWYSIGDFVKILNAAIQRSHQELFSKHQ